MGTENQSLHTLLQGQISCPAKNDREDGGKKKSVDEKNESESSWR